MLQIKNKGKTNFRAIAKMFSNMLKKNSPKCGLNL
jgi:hypothetical protein